MPMVERTVDDEDAISSLMREQRMQKVPKKPVQRKPRGAGAEKPEDATEAKETEGTGSSALAHNAAKKDAGEVWTGGSHPLLTSPKNLEELRVLVDHGLFGIATIPQLSVIGTHDH